MNYTLICHEVQKQRKNTKMSAFLIALMSLLLLNMSQYLDSIQLVSPYLLILLNAAFIVLSLSFSIFGLRILKLDKFSFLGYALLFWLFSIIPTVLNLGMYASYITIFNAMCFWFACLAFSYVYMTVDGVFERKTIFKIICVFFWVFSVRYFFWVVFVGGYVSGARNCIYYSLLLLPIVWMTRKTSHKIWMIGMAVVNTLLSAKRVAFLVLAAAILVPVLIELIRTKRKKALTTIVAILAVAVVLYSVLDKRYEISIFDRFATIAEDGGSGRGRIYTDVLRAFSRSGIVKQLFGHGFNAVALNRVSFSSAHNDFLEILYDYGLVGLMIYLSMCIRITKNAIRLYKVKSELAPMYTVALVTFFLMSMFSHLIIYPTYFAFLLLFFIMGTKELLRIRELATNENFAHKLC